MGYYRETLKGVGWVGALRGSTRAIAFVKTLILARILSPTEFGLFGIAFLVLAFLEILTETGINVFLIQKEGEIDEYVDTAWVVSILRGFLISVLILVSSPFVSLFFRSPDSLNLLLMISIVPFLRGFINPSVINFQKKLEFRKDFWFRFLIFLFDGFVAVVVGIATGKAIALVIGLIAGVLMEILLSFLFVKPVPKIRFETDKLREVINRGKWITGAGIFQYLFREGDDVVVGRVLGSFDLGLYQMAYKIATLPISELGDVFGKVTFPIYARIASDSKRLKNAYIKTTFVVSALAIPFASILILFPKEIIILLLGRSWIGAVGALRVVAIYALLRTVINPTYTLFLSLRKQEYVTSLTFLSIVGMGVSIIPLVGVYGIVGAGASTIIGSLVTLPLMFYYLKQTFTILENGENKRRRSYKERTSKY